MNPDDGPVLAAPAIAVTNTQGVGLQGEEVVVSAPRRTLTTAEALRHAAWLVALADHEGECARVLEAVQHT